MKDAVSQPGDGVGSVRVAPYVAVAALLALIFGSCLLTVLDATRPGLQMSVAPVGTIEEALLSGER